MANTTQSIEWYEAFSKVAPLVVKIETHTGHGTGFLIANPAGNDIQLIATAAHVVKEAEYWNADIKIEQAINKKSVLVEHAERKIKIYPHQDTAVIGCLSNKKGFEFQDQTLPFIAEGNRMSVGTDIGWVGYPSIADGELCFFNGKVSAWVKNEKFYYVDGTGIGGVSGGPAFSIYSNKIQLIGLVTHYKSAPGEGTVTPGLCIVRDIKHARDDAERVMNSEIKQQSQAN